MSSFLSQITHDSISLEKSVSEFNIESVVIGIRYTSVLLSNGSCGVAYTLTDQSEEKNRHNEYLSEKFLYEKDLEYLVEFCASKYSIFRGIGVAALNAFSQANLPSLNTENLDILDIFKEKSGNISMIGNIQPVTRFLSQKGYQIKILDRFAPPQPHSKITIVDGISDLRNAEHLIVSGSALVFETFDLVRDLLTTIPGEKVLLGPSAQILPAIAFKHGFTFLGSSKIINAKSVMRIIMEGGGYRAFKEFTQKYSFHLE
ncbi:hypothetical protein CEE45_05915 [Candidatus Heimdallarchaeota archaeon B3_Heim]|nr:MAG: hypothetical protein CEE45_05915 [Candidatus Heimdallarchaeota archaeon B3_Heim]